MGPNLNLLILKVLKSPVPGFLLYNFNFAKGFLQGIDQGIIMFFSIRVA